MVSGSDHLHLAVRLPAFLRGQRSCSLQEDYGCQVSTKMFDVVFLWKNNVRYDFDDPSWDDVSEEAKHLIRHLLVKNTEGALSSCCFVVCCLFFCSLFFVVCVCATVLTRSCCRALYGGAMPQPSVGAGR